MCGRFAVTLPPEAMRGVFDYVEQPNFPPRPNVAPTQPIAIVRLDPDSDGVAQRHFALVRWGFIPGFVKEPSSFPLIINARAEGIAEKPSFRAAMRRRRCLVPADAFYEWRPGTRTGPRGGRGRPVPFLIRRVDRQPMAFAALWEPYVHANGSEIDTGCLITTSANAVLTGLHERMPVIVDRQDFAAWLDPVTPHPERLLKPALDDLLEMYEVGPLINGAGADGPGLMEPVAAPRPL